MSGHGASGHGVNGHGCGCDHGLSDRGENGYDYSRGASGHVQEQGFDENGRVQNEFDSRVQDVVAVAGYNQNVNDADGHARDPIVNGHAQDEDFLDIRGRR